MSRSSLFCRRFVSSAAGFTGALVAAIPAGLGLAAEPAEPGVGPEVAFREVGGQVVVEAEHFFKQTHTGTRSWYRTTAEQTPDVKPDGDPNHAAGAGNGTYLEILPDTRRNHGHPLNAENFSNEPGKHAVLSYRVKFETAGKYHVWARIYSTNTEDNGLHVGLNGEWPASGRRMQWTGKRQWVWGSKQRTEKKHTGVPGILYLEIPEPGVHTIQFAMREDGTELDRWLMTTDPGFKLRHQLGPDESPRVDDGPGGDAGAGAEDAKPDAVTIRARDFSSRGNFYVEKERGLAIHPERHLSAAASTELNLPTGVYDVALQTVTENDGRCIYRLRVNTEIKGHFIAPLAEEAFAISLEGLYVFKGLRLTPGDTLTVEATVGTDGVEFARGRWTQLTLTPAAAPASPAPRAPPVSAAPVPPAAASPASAKPKAKAKRNKPAWPATPVATFLNIRPDWAVGSEWVEPRKPDGDGTVVVTGGLTTWRKTTLRLNGPFAHERDTRLNPFADYAMNVTFRHVSGTPEYRVPGHFAADGNAAHSGAESGTVWRAHLSPDKPGNWHYEISMRRGPGAATESATDPNTGVPVEGFDGLSGSFTVRPLDAAAPRAFVRGRLQTVEGHHLRFAGDGSYFLKVGADSPETLLAYAGFDNTVAPKGNAPLKTWAPHRDDFREGDPTWGGADSPRGAELIGAINYLADAGANAVSFLTYNAGGDGDNVWPFVEREAKQHYDVSKLDQWGVVFDHATAQGLFLHFKLQETEIDDHYPKPRAEALDGGALGPERALYFREIVSRYGHALALNWNFGEENTQSPDQQRAMTDYVTALDPYQHLRVIHTYPDWQDRVYSKLLGSASNLTGASLQNRWDRTHERTLKWRRASAAAGKPWAIANDEQGPAGFGAPNDPGYRGHDGVAKGGYTAQDIRKKTLWGNLMAGGVGVEYYFGYQLPANDLKAQDWRSRATSWRYGRHALDFFHTHLPFWEMEPADPLVGNAESRNDGPYALSKPGVVYAAYFPEGVDREAQLDLSGVSASTRFTLGWFNPRDGGALQPGTPRVISGGGVATLGFPPSDAGEDWAVVVRVVE